jgi:hypothetical protein
MPKNTAKKIRLKNRKLDARRDTVDFRDLLYVPTLVEVPSERPLEAYVKEHVPILDQGSEGACTGYALATVVHYLLRTRRVSPDMSPVSPRMLYVMAQRYDEWPGEKYEGSSARGAMKAWHKHGVCTEKLWPSKPARTTALTDDRARDAGARPLGAYFRVNHRDLVAMHAAITEVGILYATADVHEGWDDPNPDITYPNKYSGAHAFVIVGYDREGFWIQNSWGDTWGAGGFARVSYDDWLANGSDVWVARLGVPIVLRTTVGVAASRAAASGARSNYSQAHLRPHIISLGNQGRLRESGPFGTGEADLEEIFTEDFPRITKSWKKKRILLYAHGGLVSEENAIQRLADYWAQLATAEVYPISFVWHSDYWTTVSNILEDAKRRRQPEGFLGSAMDFMLDRTDDLLEVLARKLSGKAAWDEMKENALAATTSKRGGAGLAARYIADIVNSDPEVELHVIGHSAGSIFHAPLVQLLATKGAITNGPMKGKKGYGLPVKTVTLWAPACTMELFHSTYMPLIQNGRIGSFSLFTLDDQVEQADHCAHIYRKSLLYLVSNAFEKPKPRFGSEHGEPILGMQRWVERDPKLASVIGNKMVDWIRSPNNAPEFSSDASKAQHHGDFDDDVPTVLASLHRILGGISPKLKEQLGGAKEDSVTDGGGLQFQPSASSLSEQRLQL